MKLKCSKCKNDLPADHFWKDKHQKSGYTSRCKLCLREYARTHKEQIRNYPSSVRLQKKRAAKNKIKMAALEVENKQLCEMYLGGLSLGEMERRTERCRTYIRKVLRAAGINIILRPDKLKVDESFFSVPNLLNSYWAGFIAADGHIRKTSANSGWLSIGIKTTDRVLLERFVQDVGWEGEIQDRKRERLGTICEISEIKIGSKQIYHDLMDVFHLSQDKTTRLEPPDLPPECKLAYIIGYIDGDGSIKYYSHHSKAFHFTICGGLSDTILQWMKKTFEQKFQRSIGTIAQRKASRKNGQKQTQYLYQLYSQTALDVLEWLNAVPVGKLERKWSAIEAYKNRPKYNFGKNTCRGKCVYQKKGRDGKPSQRWYFCIGNKHYYGFTTEAEAIKARDEERVRLGCIQYDKEAI